MSRRRPTKRQFGTVSQLPSGRWRARYTGPDGVADLEEKRKQRKTGEQTA